MLTSTLNADAPLEATASGVSVCCDEPQGAPFGSCGRRAGVLRWRVSSLHCVTKVFWAAVTRQAMDDAPAPAEQSKAGQVPSGAATASIKTSAASRLVALQRRVVCLEERVSSVQELETRLRTLERDLMLSKSSISGLSALQQVSQVNTLAQGVALQACLRTMLKKRVDTRPEVLTSKRKRRAKVLTIEHVTTRDAVDQLLAVASMEAECTRGVRGRVSGRVVRCSGAREVLSLIGCSCEEAESFQSKTFTRLNGSVSTRLLLERFVDEEGIDWFLLRRDVMNETVIAIRRQGAHAGTSQKPGPGLPQRSTIKVDALSGLSVEGPALFRWVALGDPVLPARSTDGNVAGKLTVTVPVCVVEDDAKDVTALLGA